MTNRILTFISGAYLSGMVLIFGYQWAPSFANFTYNTYGVPGAPGCGYGYSGGYDRGYNASWPVPSPPFCGGTGYENILTFEQRQQREVLLTFYNTTNGKSWVDSTGWNGEPGTECDWFGITCSGTTVVQLELPGNNLRGRIPSELGSLKDLSVLDLSGNLLNGNIPDSLSELSSLTQMLLHSNTINGDLPSWIGELTELERLYLADNNFRGGIPENFKELKNLTILYLSNNSLTGGIPANFESLEKLSYLLLDNNSFEGNIPVGIGKLENLVALTLNANLLSGDMPSEIFTLEKIEYLLLNNNSFSGIIPNNISLLKNLTYLSLNDNNLIGDLPVEVGSLNKLGTLNLANNQISGLLGSKLNELINLNFLDLSYNQFVGTISNELSNIKELEYLNVSNNNFNGLLPAFNNIDSLKSLDISNNRFQGPLPEWLSAANFEVLNYENSLNLAPTVQISLISVVTKISNESLDISTYAKVDSDGEPGEPIYLSGLAIAGDGPVIRLAWLVDGEVLSTNSTLESRLLDKRSKIEFAAMDDLGEISITALEIDILPPVPPTAKIVEEKYNYVDTDGVRGETIQFKGVASDPDGSIQSERWLVNNQIVATGPEASISLPNGNSSIVFQVTDNVGLQASQSLEIFVEPPQYTPTLTWPYAYNGSVPNPNLGLLLNNIGVYEASSGLWRSCARLLMNDQPYNLNGGSLFDVNFRLVSGETPGLQLDSLRRFNQTGALLNSGASPDCSGLIDLGTGSYKDTVSAGSSTFDTEFELIDDENVVFGLKNFKQLNSGN